MRKVYICSPYRAADSAQLDRNIDYAQALTKQAIKVCSGEVSETDTTQDAAGGQNWHNQ